MYNFMDLRLVHHIEMMANPKGLCVVSHAPNSFMLACSGLQHGKMRVKRYGLKRTRFLTSHDSRIACFALTLMATSLRLLVQRGLL